jgi:hypothetical protein
MNEIRNKALVYGLDDWCGIWLHARNAAEELETEDSEEVCHAVMQAISELVTSGLASVGDLVSGSFVPWRMPVDDVLDKIERDWRARSAS